MRKTLLWILLALSTAAQAVNIDLATAPVAALKPLPQQSKAAYLAAEVLSRHHYRSLPLDDALSEKIFDQYLKSLDGERQFFIQPDIDQLAAMRTRLDNAILDEDLRLPFAIFNLYTQRAAERYAYARGLLQEGFDFRQKESYQFMREKQPWLKSEAEARQLWRKRVKNDWLRLKLAGKDDKSIVETLDKRYDLALKRIARVKSEDAFQAFMNAYTMAIEPHTNYMGPRAAEDFDISMKLSLVGIGAALVEKDDYTTVRELIAGGPAFLSGQLKIGDRILGVAEGENGNMTDIMGWRLDDAVALIRGAADTVVVLDVLPAEAGPDGTHKRVSLLRKKITLEEQAAKKAVLPVKDGKITRRVGVITLATFYEDYEGRQKGAKEFKSATRDVARLLRELKTQKVDSVLLDLRGNGGGSLKEAVELTGLFIGKGPVVQQRNAKGRVTVERDIGADQVWDGPLGVLIDRGSASATEIFAAAIQDYGRGLVIGESSFGKGTVQAMIDLDRVARNDKQKLGEIKLTVAQFFRINGGTTQLRGVKPDIQLPSMGDAESFGESSYDNALPWAQINPANYSPAGDVKSVLPVLRKRHEARVKTDKEFQYLLQDVAEFKLQRKKNLISLNEVERRQERNIREARLKSREANRGGGDGNSLRDDGLQANERNLSNDLAAEKAGKNAKDILLTEAVRILGDEVGLLKPGASFASRFKPGAALTPVQKQRADTARRNVL
jgi:carboxyl-terminal processing protease